MAETIDALFISFYSNIDRWQNDLDTQPSVARSRGLLTALSNETWMKDEVDVVIEGELYDFSRFLSWVRYDTTAEFKRYDPFRMTLLAGSYYLNLLHRNGFDVRLANAVDRKEIRRLGAKYTPRFVLLSTTLLFDAAERDAVAIAVQQLHKEWPEAIIVLGGLMLVSYEKNLSKSAFHNLLLRYNADVYVVTPRGEAPLIQILRRSSKSDLLGGSPIPSTYVLKDGVVHEPPVLAEPNLSLEDTYIRWSDLPQTDQLYHTVHMRTARSCAFKCAFCEYPINQGPLTLVPLEAVEKELNELRSLGTVKSIIFTDDTFNVPLGRFKELLKVLRNYDFEWYSFFRPQYADAETASLMRDSHCRAIFAGLESVDSQVLKNMNKAARPEDYRRGIELLKKEGIGVHVNFIIGFPGDTVEAAQKIVPFLNDTEVEFCTICTWMYIPSTPIAARAREFGIEGMGVEWKHSTMTSREADILARQLAAQLKFSVHNAVRGEAWSEFMMYANGFTTSEAQLAVRAFNRWIGRDLSKQEIRSNSECAKLKAVLERREMPN